MEAVDELCLSGVKEEDSHIDNCTRTLQQHLTTTQVVPVCIACSKQTNFIIVAIHSQGNMPIGA